MPVAVPKPKTKGAPSKPIAEAQPQGRTPFRITGQQASLALMLLALLYAFLAGFHTVADFDMGWHLATGRYVVEHRAIPATDVLSYTTRGAEWHYPPFAGVLLYGVHSAFGYVGLTWFCALALMVLVASLLRGPWRRESGVAAALAIVAVPVLALRITPRADLFTHLFFALFLALLWSFHQSRMESAAPARWREYTLLWMLPPAMLLWVNFHPGFIAGLGLLLGYLLIEALELIFSGRRAAAVERLRKASLPLLATALCTLFNPYGFRIFQASLHLAGVAPSAQPSISSSTSQPGGGPAIGELEAVRFSLTGLAQALQLRNPASSYWCLVLAAAVIIVLACRRLRFGAALLMAASLFVGVQHSRYKGLFAIVAVVVGSTILAEAFAGERKESTAADGKAPRTLHWLPLLAAVALCGLACFRIGDLITSRSYLRSAAPMLFGAGESAWFPERAAAFIRNERLPGNIFQSYNLGGFTAWRLGPAYPDFIDGRNVDPAVWSEYQSMMTLPLDSAEWQAEAERRNIEILLFPLSRINGIVSSAPNTDWLCQSKQWRPVYMDEVSIVLLRDQPETHAWIDRYPVDCQTIRFDPPAHASRVEMANFYANAGTILSILRRTAEAEDDLERSVRLSSDDPNVHLILAQIYDKQHRSAEAEREFKAALSLKSDIAGPWFVLAKFYYLQGRAAEARPLAATASQLALRPYNEYILLGRVDAALDRPEQALKDFDKAEAAVAELRGHDDTANELTAQIAEARGRVYLGQKDWEQAIAAQLEATQKTPNVAKRWDTLADIYDDAGRPQLAEQAHERALALAK